MLSKPVIFLSHIHEDKDFAVALKEWLEDSFLGAIDVFVSSSPDSLPPGSDWPRELKKKLGEASAMLLVLSPESLGRHWIYFEAGNAYVQELPVVPLCVAGVDVRSLRPPLSFLQALTPDDAKQRLELLKLVATTISLRTPRTADGLTLPDRKGKVGAKTDDVANVAPPTPSSEQRIAKIACKDARAIVKQLDESDLEDWKVGYERVRAVLDVAFRFIPPREEAIDLLADFPDRDVVAFLLQEFKSEKWKRWTHEWIIRYLAAGDFGELPLTAYKTVIRNQKPDDKQFDVAVSAARAALGERFDECFKDNVGLTYDSYMSKFREQKDLEERRQLERERMRLELEQKEREQRGT